MNILLQNFKTPFNSIPFSKISTKDFREVLPKAIELARIDLENITNNNQEPNFYNTVEALENSGKLLDRICNVFFNLNSAETNPEMQEIAQWISPQLTEYSNDVLLNQKLFRKIEKVWQDKTRNLNAEQERLLEITYKNFTRNGAKLSDKEKENLRDIDKELALLSLKFGENVLEETNKYHLQVEDEIRLSGIPNGILDAAQKEAENRGLSGWVFSLQYPSYIPFMKYCADRMLRKELSEAFGSKCFKNNELDNQEIIKKSVVLRAKRAQLLGYKNHAHFVLEERMAKSADEVEVFLTGLLEKVKDKAIEEVGELAKMAKEDGVEQMESFDQAYYAEKLRQKKYSYDEEKFREYFPLEQVEEGYFAIVKRMFGLSFVLRKDIDVYNPDVKVFEVLDENNNHKGLFYADYFPRKGKRAGAWMTSFQSQHWDENLERKPQVSIVCNFTKPTETKPSLLSFDEVTTFFHECGHALHGLLANNQYKSLASPNVLWDFVELPSQFMENYCYEKEALTLFAKHYKTQEKPSNEMIEILKKSANFHSAYQTVRQIGLAKLDMSWHSINAEDDLQKSVAEFEWEATQDTILYPSNKKTNTSCSFSHIFQGGYSAGYYSYKWAEVLDADAFEYFKEIGIFDPTLSKKFQKLLESGNTKEPMQLYKEFRGKKPDEKALLKRIGV